MAILVLVCIPLCGSSGGDVKLTGTPPRTNVELMQGLIEALTIGLAERCRLASGDSVDVRFVPAEDGWIAMQGITMQLKANGLAVFLSTDGHIHPVTSVDISGITLGVRYENMFREGFFGARKVTRAVAVGFSYQSTSSRTQEVVASGKLSQGYSDTVDVDAISALEYRSAGTTHAEIPPENFLDRVVEPFIIIGATRVAVYLFFHVRS